MKKLIFTAILFISMGTMAMAQQADHKKTHKTPEEKAQHLTNSLDKKLSLTADQKSKIYAISLDGIKQMKKSHVKGQKPDPSVMKTEMDKRDGQISAVLNSNQRKAYQEWKVEKMKSMKKHRKGDHHKHDDKV
jgi:protein CpxP